MIVKGCHNCTGRFRLWFLSFLALALGVWLVLVLISVVGLCSFACFGLLFNVAITVIVTAVYVVGAFV